MVNLELLSTRDVAHRLNLTPQQVARLVRAGKLEVATRGPGLRGPLLFDPEVVEQAAAGRAAGTAPAPVVRHDANPQPAETTR